MRSCDSSTCLRLDKVSFGFGGKIYRDGVKYCSTCSIFIKTDGHRCPCCNSNLRCKSHTKKWRNTTDEDIFTCISDVKNKWDQKSKIC